MRDRRAVTPVGLALEKAKYWQTSVPGPRLTQFQIRARERVVVVRNCGTDQRIRGNEEEKGAETQCHKAEASTTVR